MRKATGAGPRSKALFEKARSLLVGGVSSPVRAFGAVGGEPLFVAKAKGGRFTDADGRVYSDFCLSWGPLILGHAHPAVVKAAEGALRRGSSYGAPTQVELELAEAISRALPSMELLRFTSSGTEAVMSALRLARAATRRDKVVKFAGGYHGHADSLLVQAGSGAATFGVPDSAGVPAAWAQDTVTLPYNDAAAAAEAFDRFGEEIAAVIVEPVAANMGVVPPAEGFLKALRALTQEHGALLVFDEVVSGFRLDYGGAQTLFGIEPDLTTLGKIIGGGFPVGAYGGRRELMRLVAPLGPVYQAGTLSGNPVAMAAGLATLRTLERERPYGRLGEAAARLADALRGAAIEAMVPAQIQQAGSMLTVFFSEHPATDYATAKKADPAAYAAFFHGLLEQGVYFPPSQFEAAMLCAAHTRADLDRLAEAAARAFRRVAARAPARSA